MALPPPTSPKVLVSRRTSRSSCRPPSCVKRCSCRTASSRSTTCVQPRDPEDELCDVAVSGRCAYVEQDTPRLVAGEQPSAPGVTSPTRDHVNIHSRGRLLMRWATGSEVWHTGALGSCSELD